VRSGLGGARRPTAEAGRSLSFGALPGGSILRLHDMGIREIREVDED